MSETDSSLSVGLGAPLLSVEKQDEGTGAANQGTEMKLDPATGIASGTLTSTPDATVASTPSSSAEQSPPAAEPNEEQPVEELEAPLPVSLAGEYRVSHGSLTLGEGRIAAAGALVTLTHDEAKALLASGTITKD